MATSAFKSTTKRTSINSPSNAAAKSGSSIKSHRCSRSLSRFSRLLPDPPEFADTPKGRFINTARRLAFLEISLDDLAIEFFSFNDSLDERDSQRGQSSRRCLRLVRRPRRLYRRRGERSSPNRTSTGHTVLPMLHSRSSSPFSSRWECEIAQDVSGFQSGWLEQVKTSNCVTRVRESWWGDLQNLCGWGLCEMREEDCILCYSVYCCHDICLRVLAVAAKQDSVLMVYVLH